MNAFIRIVLFGFVISISACGGGGAGPPFLPECLLCFSDPKIKIKPGISASVGLDQTVIDGDTVRLAGGVRTSGGCLARHEWKQTSGPRVGINGSTALHPRFTAPALTVPTILTFKLKAWCTNSDRKDAASVNVYVKTISATALCPAADLYTHTYVWTASGCTSSPAEQLGDTRVVTLYRQSETEPNNSGSTANSLTFPHRIGTERLAADVAGNVTGSGDPDDIFLLSPPVSGLYEINLCNDPVACTRGTVSDRWSIAVLDQDMEAVTTTHGDGVVEQTLWVDLDAGLPYYIRVHVVEPSSPRWTYNMTVLSEPG
jgi:hypothetical protein